MFFKYLFETSLHCIAKSRILEDKAAKSSVVFLLDTSGNDESNLHNYDSVQNLLAEVALNLTMNQVQVGVVSFSSKSSVDVNLQLWKNDPDTLKTLIHGVHYVERNTNTHLAIDSAASELGSEGNRIIVLFSDGEATDPEAARDAANKAKKAGILIHSVGIGKEMNFGELKSLSSFSPRNYSSVSVENIVLDIMKMIAPEIYSDGKFCI